MVEITVACDHCGRVMGSVDVSNCIGSYCHEDRWAHGVYVSPRYYPSLNLPQDVLCALDTDGWQTGVYNGRRYILCGDCLKELNDALAAPNEEIRRIEEEFFKPRINANNDSQQ